MNKRVLIISLLLVFMGAITFNLFVIAKNNQTSGLDVGDYSYNISPTSNFFGQKEDQTKVELPDDYEMELMIKGFKFVSETDRLELYVKESYFNLAVYDKQSGYLWYSVNPNYLRYMLSGTSRFFVESGVIIEYYNMDNISIDDSKSYLSGPKYNVNKVYDYTDNGLVAHIEFADLGIRFDVEVSIQGDSLKVHLPIASLTEEDVEKTMLNLDGTTYQKVTQYRLKSVYLFPYFGSNNYEINGYSVIPDGSGALVRYNEERSNTAYIKRIYGVDEGVSRYRDETSSYYIRDEFSASLPIFGVNHGYEQAAFLAVVSEGDGYSEIHSYPYGYNSYPFNTTFAKFIVRERYTIQTSSNTADSFQMINPDPYPTDFTVDYYFLANQESSYSGMAAKYREVLGLNQEAKDFKTSLTVIGMDYKNGLFGKDFIEMTNYQDLIAIVNELDLLGLDLEIIYQAWNQGGYYDNTQAKPQVARLLGGKDDYTVLKETLEMKGIDLYYLTNPLISYDQSLGKQIIRKTTLSVFQTNEGRTSLFRSSYYTNPDNIADSILKYNKNYQDLGITALALASVGDTLFTYRYNSINYYRQDMIAMLRNELMDLNAYQLALYQPNAYLYEYLDRYLSAPVESNKYAYVTDSIPFIQLVLAGSVHLSSTYINYVSDYDLMALRLIEYGTAPAFLITKESTHNLRYTNSEYIYTSEYELWKETIQTISEKTQNALTPVVGLKMLSHKYIDAGVAEVVYEDGSIIYVNYNTEDYTIGGLTINANDYLVVRP